MTLAKAERITGLRLVGMPIHGGILFHGILDSAPDGFAEFASASPWATGVGLTQTAALDDLVAGNYRKNATAVCRKQQWRCARCGNRRPLQAHHRKRRSRGRDDQIGNLEGLCQDCHEKAHR